MEPWDVDVDGNNDDIEWDSGSTLTGEISLDCGDSVIGGDGIRNVIVSGVRDGESG